MWRVKEPPCSLILTIGKDSYEVLPVADTPEKRQYDLVKLGNEKQTTYRLSENNLGPSCSCIGFKTHKKTCKHIEYMGRFLFWGTQ